MSSGFTNELFFTVEDTENLELVDGKAPDARNFKWTLASYGSPSEADNGKYNCDTDFKEKAAAAKYTFLHQV